MARQVRKDSLSRRDTFRLGTLALDLKYRLWKYLAGRNHITAFSTSMPACSLFSSTHTPLSWIPPTSTLNCRPLFLLTCSRIAPYFGGQWGSCLQKAKTTFDQNYHGKSFKSHRRYNPVSSQCPQNHVYDSEDGGT